MEKVYDICCGIDVHKKLKEIRQTGATTRELLELADWLKSAGCQMVAMESTGSYWKPLYNILETSGLSAMAVNARHWTPNGLRICCNTACCGQAISRIRGSGS